MKIFSLKIIASSSASLIIIYETGSDQTFSIPSEFEKIQTDYGASGISTHGHPMLEIRKQEKTIPQTTSQDIKKMKHGNNASVAGLVLIRQKPPTAKGVVFCTIEDEFGFVDLILHAEVYKMYKDIFMNHCFIMVSGILQRDGYTVSLLVKKIEAIWGSGAHSTAPLELEPTTYFYS